MEKRGITPDRQRIMPVPASMDHERAKEERRREQVDAPKSREAIEREDKEKRQKQEREASWAGVLQAKKSVRVRMEQANAVSEKWQTATTDKATAEEKEKRAVLSYGASKAQAVAQRLTVSEWKEAHKIRAFFGMVPQDVTKCETVAQLADQKAKTAQEEQAKAKLAKEKAEEKIKVLHAVMIQHRQVAEKEQATRTEAEKDHARLIRMHQRQNLTPAQVKAEEQAEEAMMRRMSPDLFREAPQGPQQHQRPQGPQQRQEQQHTRKGPQLKPDWGQSL
jgi:hypothetical protein